MGVEWMVAATIAAPILALFVGAWLNHLAESRPILNSYFGHVGAFTYRPPNGNPIQVHTHQVVIRNVGRRTATNVRMHHTVLPDFSIRPPVQHHVDTLPDGSQDIVIPALVPGEVITVSYLYFPPVTWDQVNAGIKSDDGFARAIPVLLQRVYPQWLNRLGAFFMLVGVVAVVYVLYMAVRAAIAGWIG